MQATLSISGNARKLGDRTAVLCEARSYSWAELEGLVSRFAGVLKKQGVAPGDRVAILADNCDLYLAGFYAIPWAGAILLPLNTRLSPFEVAELIDHGKPSLVLHDETRAGLLADALGHAAHQPATLPLRGGAQSVSGLLAETSPIPDANRRGDDPAAIFYTGGTTGRSKGAVMTHHNHMYNTLMMWTELGADIRQARYLHAPPMFHMADALFIHAMTTIGALHIVLPHFDAEKVIEAIARHEITDIYLVPTMVASFLDALERNPRPLPSLERIFYGAMPMPEATARRLIRLLPQAGPIQLYGQSEAGPVMTMLLPEDHDVSGATMRLRSAGRPLPGVEIAIHDPDGNELPPMEVGEIVGKSGAIMPGYWDDPDQSANTLRGGWLHTGDGGYLDEDGFVYVVDRIKDMIISGGENIYSVEVERAITLHPAVAQCAVIGVPDERWGERVHAAVVLRPGETLSAEALQTHCREYIAGYKLPRSFDWRDSLPLSGPGKILKRVLREEAIRAAAAR